MYDHIEKIRSLTLWSGLLPTDPKTKNCYGKAVPKSILIDFV